MVTFVVGMIGAMVFGLGLIVLPLICLGLFIYGLINMMLSFDGPKNYLKPVGKPIPPPSQLSHKKVA